LEAGHMNLIYRAVSHWGKKLINKSIKVHE
jgi:hypothetical protein